MTNNIEKYRTEDPFRYANAKKYEAENPNYIDDEQFMHMIPYKIVMLNNRRMYYAVSFAAVLQSMQGKVNAYDTLFIYINNYFDAQRQYGMYPFFKKLAKAKDFYEVAEVFKTGIDYMMPYSQGYVVSQMEDYLQVIYMDKDSFKMPNLTGDMPVSEHPDDHKIMAETVTDPKNYHVLEHPYKPVGNRNVALNHDFVGSDASIEVIREPKDSDVTATTTESNDASTVENTDAHVDQTAGTTDMSLPDNTLNANTLASGNTADSSQSHTSTTSITTTAMSSVTVDNTSPSTTTTTTVPDSASPSSKSTVVDNSSQPTSSTTTAVLDNTTPPDDLRPPDNLRPSDDLRRPTSKPKLILVGEKLPNLYTDDVYTISDAYTLRNMTLKQAIIEARKDGLTFSEQDLKNLNKTFNKTIADNILDDPTEGPPKTPKTDFYRSILSYYKNNKTDCVVQGLQQLETFKTAKSPPLDTSKFDSSMPKRAGCVKIAPSDNQIQPSPTVPGSCTDQYKKDMDEAFKKMLGDCEFYCAFMNPTMYSMLQQLLGDFIKGVTQNPSLAEPLNQNGAASQSDMKQKCVSNYANDIHKCAEFDKVSSMMGSAQTQTQFNAIQQANAMAELLKRIANGESPMDMCNSFMVTGTQFADFLLQH